MATSPEFPESIEIVCILQHIYYIGSVESNCYNDVDGNNHYPYVIGIILQYGRHCMTFYILVYMLELFQLIWSTKAQTGFLYDEDQDCSKWSVLNI